MHNNPNFSIIRYGIYGALVLSFGWSISYLVSYFYVFSPQLDPIIVVLSLLTLPGSLIVNILYYFIWGIILHKISLNLTGRRDFVKKGLMLTILFIAHSILVFILTPSGGLEGLASTIVLIIFIIVGVILSWTILPFIIKIIAKIPKKILYTICLIPIILSIALFLKDIITTRQISCSSSTNIFTELENSNKPNGTASMIGAQMRLNEEIDKFDAKTYFRYITDTCISEETRVYLVKKLRAKSSVSYDFTAEDKQYIKDNISSIHKYFVSRENRIIVQDQVGRILNYVNWTPQ